MAKIEKKSLVDQIYETLRKEIISLKRKPESKLNVAEIQEELDVSCTPVREAINRLQQEGIIIYHNNIGANVIKLNPHDIDEIMQLGNTLHCAAVKLSLNIMQNKENLLKDLDTQYERLLKATTDDEEIEAIHLFFGAFYWHCGNARLDKSMTALKAQQLMVRNMAVKVAAKRAEEADYLKLMKELAETGDTKGICKAIEDYSSIITLKAKTYLKKEYK